MSAPHTPYAYAASSLPDVRGMPPRSMPPVLQDPLAIYKAFQDTATTERGGKNENVHEDDVYAYPTESTGAAQDLYGAGGEQANACVIPYHVAARFANRSNGAPLATILEQGSYSTLNSQKASPGRASHKVLRNFEETTLDWTRMNVPLAENTMPAKDMHAVLLDRGRSHALPRTTTPMALMSNLQQSPGSQTSDRDHDADTTKPKSLPCRVGENLLADSCARAYPSLTHAPIFDPPAGGPRTCDNSPPHLQDHGRLKRELFPLSCKALNATQTSHSTSLSSETRPSNRTVSLTKLKPAVSVSSHALLHKLSLPSLEPASSFESVPHLLPPAARSREQPGSVRIVPPEPRDVAGATVTTEVLTHSSRQNDTASAHKTYDGVYTLCFKLERQASCSESPKKSKQATAPGTNHRLITSSALTSLLPVATASGIMHANYHTPKISFYSPSGSLIQPEGSSSPGITISAAGSPASIASRYKSPDRSTINRLQASACLPPSRPTLVPMTTPPVTTAPLPEHLRHHHNYKRHERPEIGSCESLIEPTQPVRGCGGIVRTSSLALHRGLRQPPSYKKSKADIQHKQRQSTRSIVRDLGSDVRFYKSRYIALVAQSCNSSRNKSRKKCIRTTLHKRKDASNEAHGPIFPPQQGPQSTQQRDSKSEIAILGPLAGHALRVCFCQPYDGAGKSTRVADASGMGRGASGMHDVRYNKETDLHTEDEGIARVVSLVRQNKQSAGGSRAVSLGSHVNC
ncbi:hypothetical protein BDU57DRAFT_543168 [Ampelomyces quisqualis]|uniref:Uncharacterized protein n=1 Tax=Ampelomyces quisqualis TaxID=50730 RepID=A0A6A5QAD5_AMPQU|nr:hypothetical protein BDU57DRAFT_543168 [Ampelomyces quisqualis]